MKKYIECEGNVQVGLKRWFRMEQAKGNGEGFN